MDKERTSASALVSSISMPARVQSCSMRIRVSSSISQAVDMVGQALRMDAEVQTQLSQFAFSTGLSRQLEHSCADKEQL